MKRGRRELAWDLDWGLAEAMAYRLLGPAGAVRTGTHGGALRFRSDSYWSESLQNAVLLTLSRVRAGLEALPQTTAELANLLARRARHNDDNRRLAERRRRELGAVTSVDPNALASVSRETAWALDLLNAVIARDLFAKLIARLYEELDVDGRNLLDAWLVLGIDLDDSLGLQDAMQEESVQTVTNIKRRVRYRAVQIMADLVGDSGAGDAS